MALDYLLTVLQTNQGLKIILLHAFNSILGTDDCNFYGDIFLAVEQTLIDSQSQIGWLHILFERLSLEWVHIKREMLDPCKYSRFTWAIKIHKYIWHALHNLWLVQNKSIHGTTFQESKDT
jgi:hypothetical protein